jgi:hypothetical protein
MQTHCSPNRVRRRDHTSRGPRPAGAQSKSGIRMEVIEVDGQPPVLVHTLRAMAQTMKAHLHTGERQPSTDVRALPSWPGTVIRHLTREDTCSDAGQNLVWSMRTSWSVRCSGTRNNTLRLFGSWSGPAEPGLDSAFARRCCRGCLPGRQLAPGLGAAQPRGSGASPRDDPPSSGRDAAARSDSSCTGLTFVAQA